MLIIRAARLADVPAIARVHVESWRATYAGIMPEDYLGKLSYEWRERTWHTLLNEANHWAFVAEETPAGIIGFCDGGKERTGNPVYTGELYAIYLVGAYQRRGIGRRLVAPLARHLLAQGMGSMLVWVLAQNPARAFYETLGGERVDQKSILIGDVTLAEVAYGWRDIEALAKLDG